LVLVAGGGASDAALDQLCRTYWPPLYAFLRRDGKSPADAQDLVQGFLARLLAREDLATVSADRGRFRTFLLTALRNHVIKQAAHEHALKRGGGRQMVPLDLENAETLCGADLSAESPEKAFARRWAQTVLARAYQRLREEQHARGRASLFEALATCFESATDEDYQRIAELAGMKWETVRVTAFRLRRRLGDLFKAEVAETLGPGADVEAEVRELLAALAGD
jgi:RNA polymerase sigma factor (sigma-70 family)